MGRIDNQQAGPGIDGVLEPLPVDAKFRPQKGNVPSDALAKGDCWLVRIVGRIEYDHFIQRMHHSLDRHQ